MSDSPAVTPIPEGSVLLHIGPQKTGSTAIQESLHNARQQLADLGVFYPGPYRRPIEAGWAVLGHGAPLGRPEPRIETWDALIEGLHASTLPRRILSNEDLSRGSDAVVERIVSDVGADDVQLLYVARRYDQLLPSHWQERLKARVTLSFEDFLRTVLEGASTTWEWRLMWECQFPDQVLASWGRFIPPERTTVIVLEGGDHDALPSAFEQLLDLPTGLLVPPDVVANRSYTFPEAEALRRINRLAAQEKWPDRRYLDLVRRGVARRWTNSPRPEGAARIPGLPAWALDRVNDLADQQADALLASGCRLIGSPDSLRTRDRVTPYDGPMELADVPLDLLEEAVGALAERAARSRKRALSTQRKRLSNQGPDPVGTRELGGSWVVASYARCDGRDPQAGASPHPADARIVGRKRRNTRSRHLRDGPSYPVGREPVAMCASSRFRRCGRRSSATSPRVLPMTTPSWEPPFSASPTGHLVAALDRQRATFRWKADGLDRAGLAHGVGRVVAEHRRLAQAPDPRRGHPLHLGPRRDPSPAKSWRSHDWDADPDWDFESAGEDEPADLYAAYDAAVARSREILAAHLADGGLEQHIELGRRHDIEMSLGRLVADMLEEYGRHTGHADLLREDVDGRVGEDPEPDWEPPWVARNEKESSRLSRRRPRRHDRRPGRPGRAWKARPELRVVRGEVGAQGLEIAEDGGHVVGRGQQRAGGGVPEGVEEAASPPRTARGRGPGRHRGAGHADVEAQRGVVEDRCVRGEDQVVDLRVVRDVDHPRAAGRPGRAWKRCPRISIT